MGTYSMAQGPLLVLWDDLNGKGIQKKRGYVYMWLHRVGHDWCDLTAAAAAAAPSHVRLLWPHGL